MLPVPQGPRVLLVQLDRQDPRGRLVRRVLPALLALKERLVRRVQLVCRDRPEHPALLALKVPPDSLEFRGPQVQPECRGRRDQPVPRVRLVP